MMMSKKTKKIGQWLLPLLLIFLIFIFGCSKTEQTVTEKDDKPITLRINCQIPAPEVSNISYSIAVKRFGEELIKRSNGKIKPEHYWSTTLTPMDKTLYALRDRTMDICTIAPGFFPAELPLQDATNLNFQSMSLWGCLKTAQQLDEEFEAYHDEWERNNIMVLAQSGSAANCIMTADKPVRKLEDLDGLKMRSYGVTAWLLEELGATPVAMPASDLMVALERGTVDGFSGQPIHMLLGMGYHEVCDYYIDASMGNYGIMPLCMNIDAWNELSPELQKIVKEAAQDTMVDEYAKLCYYGTLELWDKYSEKGIDMYKLPADEVQKLREVNKRVVWDRWIQEKEAKGLPGQEIFDRAMELLKEYEEKDPYAWWKGIAATKMN